VLDEGQHVYFNFGQHSFAYPPKDPQFADFHTPAEVDVRRYQLQQEYFRGFPIPPVIDNRFELYYQSSTQIECDQRVLQLDESIESNLGDISLSSFDNFDFERVIQSTIEVMGNGEKGDLLSHWVGEIFRRRINQINDLKLCPLLLPYLRLRVLTPRDVAKHRALCLVLLNCIQHWKYNDKNGFNDYMHEETFAYLTRMIVESKDEWTKLFVILCLEDWKTSKILKKNIFFFT